MTYLSGGGSFRRPLLPLVIDEIKRLLKELKEIEVDEKRIKQSLENLEKKEIIDLVEKNDEIFVHLKNDNNPQVIKYSIKALLELKQKEK